MKNRYLQLGVNTAVEVTWEELALHFIETAITFIKKDTLPTFVCPLINL